MNQPGLTRIPSYLGYRAWVMIAVVALIAYFSIPNRLKLAHRLLVSARPEEAATLLEQAILVEEDPTIRSEILEELANVELKLGKREEAIKYQEQSVEAAPDSVKARVRLAQIYELFCRPEEAMRELEKAIAKFRQWKAENRPDIEDLARGLRVLAPTDIPSKDNLKIRFEEWFFPIRRKLAWYERWFQQLEPAIQTHKEIVEESPRDYETWFNLSRLYAYAGNLDESTKALETASKLKPDQKYLKDLLSYHYLWQRKPERVVEAVTQAELSRDEARRRILLAYVQAGKPKEGLEEYIRRHKEDQDYRSIWFTLVDICLEEGDYLAAKQMLEEFAQSAGEDEEVLERLGDLQMLTRDYDAAVKTYHTLLKLHPDSVKHQRWLIDALDAKGDPVGAMTQLLDLQKQDPENISLKRELAIRHAQLGQFKEARPWLEEVVVQYPEDQTILYYLAQALDQTGDPRRSAEIYQKLLEIMGPAAQTFEPPPDAEVVLYPPGAPTGVQGPVSRRVLAFYKKTEGESPVKNRIHLWLELVLNHLGLVVDYRAAEDPLPSDDEMKAYRGILTWFQSDRVPKAERFGRWLAAQPYQGRPLIVFERFGCTVDADSDTAVAPSVMEDLHRALGIKVGGRGTENPALIEVVNVDAAMCEYERKLAYETELFQEMTSVNPANTVHLQLKRRDMEDALCDAVVIGPGGAFVLATYALFEDQQEYQRQWRVNPFLLVNRALRLEAHPRPDFAMRAGTRITYVHIDGDGSDASCLWDPPLSCSEKFVEHILDKRRFPMTASFIACLVDPALFVGDHLVKAAKTVMAHPGIEIGHHTYSHPLDWAEEKPSLDVPGYSKVDMKMEVVTAREILEARLAPPGKKIELVQWSGSCNPSREAVDMAHTAKMLDLNGGDPRMDGNNPSVSNLAPVHRNLGGVYQTLTSGPNDFLLTDRWNLPSISFSNVIQTFERSWARAALVPVNLYFHYYVLSEVSGTRALDIIFDWLEKNADRLHPVFASEYVRIAEGFRTTQMAYVGPLTWELREMGACRTVRFDDFPGGVDLDRSKGVIGYVNLDGVLYVHLDGSGEGVVALGTSMATRPYLVSANAAVDDLQQGPGQLSFGTRSVGKRSFRFGGFPPGQPVRVEARAAVQDRNAETSSAVADDQGVVTFALDLSGPKQVTLITGS